MRAENNSIIVYIDYILLCMDYTQNDTHASCNCPILVLKKVYCIVYYKITNCEHFLFMNFVVSRFTLYLLHKIRLVFLVAVNAYGVIMLPHS